MSEVLENLFLHRSVDNAARNKKSRMGFITALSTILLVVLAAISLQGCGSGANDNHPTGKPVSLIIDTDMSTDIDDVIAVVAALNLDVQKQAKLLAVMHNTGLLTGAGAISVLLDYYGRNDIPIGAYKGKFSDTMAGAYVDDLVEKYNPPFKNYTQVADAVALYREVLAAQPDNSVVISSIGFLTNLANLLTSEPDTWSPLSGVQLVAQKVKKIAAMGGVYPNSKAKGSPQVHEWNLAGGCHPVPELGCQESKNATAVFLQNWPASVPLQWLGGEIGPRVLSGAPLAIEDGSGCPGSSGPTGFAYRDFYKKTTWLPPSAAHLGRSSWDPLTTVHAVLGDPEGSFDVVSEGFNSFNVTDGSNSWIHASNATQSYLVLRPGANETLANKINDLVCQLKHASLLVHM